MILSRGKIIKIPEGNMELEKLQSQLEREGIRVNLIFEKNGHSFNVWLDDLIVGTDNIVEDIIDIMEVNNGEYTNIIN